MVGFSDDLKTETRDAECRVALLLNEMEADDRADLAAALVDTRGVPSEVIERAIRKGGYTQIAGRQAIKKHRRGECLCVEVTV